MWMAHSDDLYTDSDSDSRPNASNSCSSDSSSSSDSSTSESDGDSSRKNRQRRGKGRRERKSRQRKNDNNNRKRDAQPRKFMYDNQWLMPTRQNLSMAWEATRQELVRTRVHTGLQDATMHMIVAYLYGEDCRTKKQIRAAQKPVCVVGPTRGNNVVLMDKIELNRAVHESKSIVLTNKKKTANNAKKRDRRRRKQREKKMKDTRDKVGGQ